MTQLIASIAAETSDGGGNIVGFLLPLVLMGGLFYFLLIRPQQKRARAQAALLSSIETGDEVMTAGGLIGTVIDIDDDADIVTVEIAPGVQTRMVRRAISQKMVDEDDETYVDEDDEVVELDDADDAADERGTR
ncbi:MAG: preprotein translocase subunit YajC [Actinomycetota bacterium]